MSVRQTYYKQEEHDCDDNCGVKFHHRFKYDVDIRIKGAANCIESGYCIDYIHNRREYYQVENVDGTHTVSNSIMFNQDNPTLVIYPYVKYNDGKVKIGEPFRTKFISSSNAKAISPIQKGAQNKKNASIYPSPIK